MDITGYFFFGVYGLFLIYGRTYVFPRLPGDDGDKSRCLGLPSGWCGPADIRQVFLTSM